MVNQYLSVKSIRVLEEKARQLGLEERILIENASSNLCYIIKKLRMGKKVLIIAGRGNNGADVLACGRKLLASGYKVKIAIISPKKLKEESFYQYKILRRLIKDIIFIRSKKDLFKLKMLTKGVDFILEGILGIGINHELNEFLKDAIKILNTSAKKIISCDIPSGLNPDTGKVMGESIKAHCTITFIAPKKCFFLKERRRECGKIYIADIGVSKDILRKIKCLKK